MIIESPLPLDVQRSEETRHVAETVPGVDDVALVEITGNWMIRLTATIQGKPFSTYIACETDFESDVQAAMDNPWLLETADAHTMEMAVAHALALPGVSGVLLEPTRQETEPALNLLAPGIGRVEIPLVNLDPDWTLERELRKLRRRRTQDAEGRTITRLGAMSLALAAIDVEDLDRIVDTIFVGGTISYRGIMSEIAKGDRLVTSYSVAGARIRADGIEMGDLPDTLKLALRGDAYKGRPLSDLVDIAGFEDLHIARINGQAAANRRVYGGAGWLRIDVRDTDGAVLEDLNQEEARLVAHETYARRVSALAGKAGKED